MSDTGSGERKAITTNTYLQLGAVIAVVGAILTACGFACTCIWWASAFAATTNTKLDAVLTELKSYREEKTTLTSAVEVIRSDINVMKSMKERRDEQVKNIESRLDRVEHNKGKGDF